GGPRLRVDRAPPRGGGAPVAPAADLRQPRRRPCPEVRARVRRCRRLRRLRAGAARLPRPRRARLHAARSASRRRAGGPRGRPSRPGRETARAPARGGRPADRRRRPPQTIADMAGEDAVALLAECEGGVIAFLSNSLGAPGLPRFQWSSVTGTRATCFVDNRGRWALVRGTDGFRLRVFWRDTRG